MRREKRWERTREGDRERRMRREGRRRGDRESGVKEVEYMGHEKIESKEGGEDEK